MNREDPLAGPAAGGCPTFDLAGRQAHGSEVERLLAAAQHALFSHPVAAARVVRALAEEGRRYAATPEGAAWQRRLAASDAARRAQVAWEGTTLGLLEPAPGDDGLLPRAFVDLLARVAHEAELERLLARLPLERG